MQLRNGKQYLLSSMDKLSSDNPQTKLTPYIKSIITLFNKYIHTYDYLGLVNYIYVVHIFLVKKYY